VRKKSLSGGVVRRIGGMHVFVGQDRMNSWIANLKIVVRWCVAASDFVKRPSKLSYALHLRKCRMFQGKSASLGKPSMLGPAQHLDVKDRHVATAERRLEGECYVSRRLHAERRMRYSQ
jgi:hypothetical protein